MYARHFGLTAEPFSLTPDPEFLYLGCGHAEALAALKVAVLGGRGIMVMSGEVGTGKTTLLYALLRAIGDHLRTAYVSNTTVGFDALLRLALADFGVQPVSTARIDLLAALNRFLTECAEHGTTATLIIDEAQNLDVEAFEQVRLLSNYETFSHKLLQIVLVGQPELETRLRGRRLRALADRIAVHCRLSPLDARESRAYLNHRLLRAGGSSRLFESKARKALLDDAQGLPRRINILAHNALLFAYGRGLKRVTPAVARLAIAGAGARHEMGTRGPASEIAAPLRHVTLPIARLAMAGRSALREADPRAQAARIGALLKRVTLPVARLAITARTALLNADPRARASEIAALLKRVTVPVARLAIAGRHALLEAGRRAAASDIAARLSSALRSSPRIKILGSGAAIAMLVLVAIRAAGWLPTALPAREESSFDVALFPDSDVVPALKARWARQPPAQEPMVPPDLAISSALHPSACALCAQDPPMPAADAVQPTQLPRQEPGVVAEQLPVGPSEPRDRLVRVKVGANLLSLVRDVYGTVDAKRLRRVLDANPQVANPNLIVVGDVLHFPKEPTEAATAQGSASNE